SCSASSLSGPRFPRARSPATETDDARRRILRLPRRELMRPFLLPLLLALAACRVTGSGSVVQDFARSGDGVPVAYDVRGRGSTALVFVHGWCCDRFHWRNQVDAFAPDYRVVAIDLGGHGASGANRKTWDVAALAGDVEAVLRALRLDRVILVGHSMGG